MVRYYPALVTEGPASRLSKLSVCWDGSGALVAPLELEGLLVDIIQLISPLNRFRSSTSRSSLRSVSMTRGSVCCNETEIGHERS